MKLLKFRQWNFVPNPDLALARAAGIFSRRRRHAAVDSQENACAQPMQNQI